MYIVAPLIYFEGQSTRINLIGKRLRQILETAVLLVIVGTVFAGFSVSLLGIPLALTFLMGALSTPTDTTATESILLDKLVKTSPSQGGVTGSIPVRVIFLF